MIAFCACTMNCLLVLMSKPPCSLRVSRKGTVPSSSNSTMNLPSSSHGEVPPLPIPPPNPCEERPGEVPHDRARRIISSQDNLQKEVDRLARVLRQNGYPTNFICSAYAPPPQVLDPRSPAEDQEEESRPPAGDLNIRVIFKYQHHHYKLVLHCFVLFQLPPAIFCTLCLSWQFACFITYNFTQVFCMGNSIAII